MMTPTNQFERVPMNDLESDSPSSDLLNNSKNEKIRRQKFEKYIRIVIVIIIFCVVVNAIFAFLNYFNSNSNEFQKEIDDLKRKVNILCVFKKFVKSIFHKQMQFNSIISRKHIGRKHIGSKTYLEYIRPKHIHTKTYCAQNILVGSLASEFLGWS